MGLNVKLFQEHNMDPCQRVCIHFMFETHFRSDRQPEDCHVVLLHQSPAEGKKPSEVAKNLPTAKSKVPLTETPC